jgi:hypothetical protein
MKEHIRRIAQSNEKIELSIIVKIDPRDLPRFS